MYSPKHYAVHLEPDSANLFLRYPPNVCAAIITRLSLR